MANELQLQKITNLSLWARLKEAIFPVTKVSVKTVEELRSEPLLLCSYLGQSAIMTDSVLELLGGAWPEGGFEVFKKSRRERALFYQHLSLATARAGGKVESWMTSGSDHSTGRESAGGSSRTRSRGHTVGCDVFAIGAPPAAEGDAEVYRPNSWFEGYPDQTGSMFIAFGHVQPPTRELRLVFGTETDPNVSVESPLVAITPEHQLQE